MPDEPVDTILDKSLIAAHSHIGGEPFAEFYQRDDPQDKTAQNEHYPQNIEHERMIANNTKFSPVQKEGQQEIQKKTERNQDVTEKVTRIQIALPEDHKRDFKNQPDNNEQASGFA